MFPDCFQIEEMQKHLLMMVGYHCFHSSASVEYPYALMPVYMRILHVILDFELLLTDALSAEIIGRLSCCLLHATFSNLIDRRSRVSMVIVAV